MSKQVHPAQADAKNSYFNHRLGFVTFTSHRGQETAVIQILQGHVQWPSDSPIPRYTFIVCASTFPFDKGEICSFTLSSFLPLD